MHKSDEKTVREYSSLTRLTLLSAISATLVMTGGYLWVSAIQSNMQTAQQLLICCAITLSSMIGFMVFLDFAFFAKKDKQRAFDSGQIRGAHLDRQNFLDKSITAFEIQLSDRDKQNFISSSIRLLIGHVPKSSGSDIFSFTKHISSVDRRRVYGEIKGAIETGNELVSHYCVKHDNGRLHHVQLNGSLRRNTDTGKQTFAGSLVCVDKLYAQLSRNELLSQVFYASNDGILLTDTARNIVAANPAYCEISGFEEAEILGRNPDYFRSPKHNPEFYKNMQKQVARYGSWKGEIWNKRKTGESYPELLTITTILGEDQVVNGFLATLTDLADVKNCQKNLQQLCHQDALTGLPNRQIFNARLGNSIALANNKSEPIALFFIDIDNFKRINDSLGHETGDLMLCEIARRFSTVVREEDLLARLGGDEFTLLVNNVADDVSLLHIANKIIDKLKTPVSVKDVELLITASIGISRYPTDCESADDLMKNADIALYGAKDRGRNNVVLYTPELSQHTMERVFLENYLRSACTNKEFVLHYQPQIDLKTGKLLGAEALIRWIHPKLGFVPPDRFISIAENTGLIQEIGRWVLYEACRTGAEWIAKGLDIPSISVNLSGVQIEQKGLPRMVDSILKLTGYPATKLELEVTESVVMENSDIVVSQLNEIRDMGISISIDDFGTGYSSLAYLKHLPFNKLKIDRAFIKDTPREQNDVAITKAIIALSQSLKLFVCAEGVETPEQERFLIEADCDSAQGYFFSRPLAADDFVSWVIERYKPSVKTTLSHIPANYGSTRL